jgi:hypothetical protein
MRMRSWPFAASTTAPRQVKKERRTKKGEENAISQEYCNQAIIYGNSKLS